MMRKFLYILLLLLSGLVRGQDYQSRIYHAYLQKQMGTWKEVMEEMESVYRENPDMELLYDLIEAEYGYTAYCISVKRRREAREVLDRAMDHINLFMELEVDNPRIHSLHGAFFGFRFFLDQELVSISDFF